jgi:hypothetical protein
MEREPISLEAATGHILDGFQLIAIFDATFHEKLSQAQQLLHLAATVLVTVSIALVTAPAALHRQTERHSVSRLALPARERRRR